MPWYLHRQKHPESVWPDKASSQDGIKDAPDDCAEAGKVSGGGHPAQVEVEGGEREEVELDPANDGDDRHQRLQDDPDRATEGHLVDLAVEALQSKLDPRVAGIHHLHIQHQLVPGGVPLVDSDALHSRGNGTQNQLLDLEGRESLQVESLDAQPLQNLVHLWLNKKLCNLVADLPKLGPELPEDHVDPLGPIDIWKSDPTGKSVRSQGVKQVLLPPLHLGTDQDRLLCLLPDAIDGKVEGGKEKNPGITETKPASKIQQTPFAELPQAENIPVVKTNN